jgi:hypothetical protein
MRDEGVDERVDGGVRRQVLRDRRALAVAAAITSGNRSWAVRLPDTDAQYTCK